MENIDIKHLHQMLFEEYCTFADCTGKKCTECRIGIDIDNVCNASGWIDVSECSPKDNTEVLVIVDGYVTLATYSKGKYHSFAKMPKKNSKPAFWMPKPLPYVDYEQESVQ